MSSTGVLSFVAGYMLLQHGSTGSEFHIWSEIESIFGSPVRSLRKHLLLLLACLLSGYGFVTGAQATASVDAAPMLVSGASVVSSYFLRHLVEKEVVI